MRVICFTVDNKIRFKCVDECRQCAYVNDMGYGCIYDKAVYKIEDCPFPSPVDLVFKLAKDVDHDVMSDMARTVQG